MFIFTRWLGFPVSAPCVCGWAVTKELATAVPQKCSALCCRLCRLLPVQATPLGCGVSPSPGFLCVIIGGLLGFLSFRFLSCKMWRRMWRVGGEGLARTWIALSHEPLTALAVSTVTKFWGSFCYQCIFTLLRKYVGHNLCCFRVAHELCAKSPVVSFSLTSRAGRGNAAGNLYSTKWRPC